MSNRFPSDFNGADRIVDKGELKKLVPYSPVHIDRLEAKRRFPKRIKLGPNRVGWSLQEVQKWIEARKEERDLDTGHIDNREGK